MNNTLFNRSIEIIRRNQGMEGGYIASPTFKQYQYCWFRDGSYIAYAMDLAGQFDSAVRFYQWSNNTLRKHQAKLSGCIRNLKEGNIPGERDYFQCRFQMDGKEAVGNWGNHQLDGLGLWLWTYCRHLQMNGKERAFLIEQDILFLVRDYLAALWQYPCYDCWEENDDLHAYTLASICAGLASLGKQFEDEKSLQTAAEIKTFLSENFIHKGYFCKSKNQHIVDASLISLAVPFSIFSIDDMVIEQTIAQIAADISVNGVGLHRYFGDNYYGGGIWILLSAWLGWLYAESGKTENALAILHWIEKQANSEGELPEQICEDLYSREACSKWKEKWGDPAIPLLWSHAMYMILYLSLKEHACL
jgi:GH15 family glucan-1,4-alpha-glucosidase